MCKTLSRVRCGTEESTNIAAHRGAVGVGDDYRGGEQAGEVQGGARLDARGGQGGGGGYSSRHHARRRVSGVHKLDLQQPGRHVWSALPFWYLCRACQRQHDSRHDGSPQQGKMAAGSCEVSDGLRSCAEPPAARPTSDAAQRQAVGRQQEAAGRTPRPGGPPAMSVAKLGT